MRRLVSFDTETYRIAPGRTAPRLVCLSHFDGEKTGLVKRDEACRLVQSWLEDDRVLLVNHNIAFDLAVIAACDPKRFLPLIFDAYERDRIACTMTCQQQLDIATGHMTKDKTYSLEEVVGRWFGEGVEGKHGVDAWRLRYRELEHVAIQDWPEEARRYVVQDAVLAQRVYRRQLEQGELPDVERQYRAALVLKLIGAWGIRTDEERVEQLDVQLHKHVDHNLELLVHAGIYRWGGTRAAPKLVKSESVVKDLVYQELGQQSPLTDGGRARADAQGRVEAADVSIAFETLETCRNPNLQLLAEISADQKLLNTYIPLLRKGACGPINPRWNVLVKTGRTSCSGPNLQNQPRKPGVRECFVPRTGWLFISSDYHTAELRSLAQVLLDGFGESKMAETLRAGRDIHLVTGATILGISYDEIVRWYEGPHAPLCTFEHCVEHCLKKKAKDARQLSKAANFGFPGGLGAAAFVDYAAGPDYKIHLTQEQSSRIREAWLDRYPEMNDYFGEISRQVNMGGGSFELRQPRSGRIRGDCGYTDGANSFFQGLTADGMKDAAWHIVKEMYDPRCSNSKLYGARVNALIHDEVFAEAPEEQAPEAAERLSEVMVERMSVWLPDIPVLAKPALMRRWSKAAGDPVRDRSGRLIPWEDQKVA